MTEPDFEQTVLLVQRAQAGDGAAIESLFERYLPRVRRIAGIRLGHTTNSFTELDDIVQESLLDAFSDLQDFQPRTDGSFCNWLARCVENNIRDGARRSNAQKRGGGRVKRFADLGTTTGSPSQFDAGATSPSQAARAHELDAQIEAAMLQLNERYREAIILRTVCGMSAREMAEELQLERAEDAQKLFERARQRLAALLEG